MAGTFFTRYIWKIANYYNKFKNKDGPTHKKEYIRLDSRFCFYLQKVSNTTNSSAVLYAD